MTEDPSGQAPEVELLKSFVTSIERRSGNFTEMEVELDAKITEALHLQEHLQAKHRGLKADRDYVLRERERMLRTKLERQGLAICSRAGADPLTRGAHYGFESIDGLAGLGVFPKDQMTLVYIAHTEISRTPGESDRTPRRKISFDVLCPGHAPQRVFMAYSRETPHGLGPDEWTRVTVEEDGRLIREIDGEQVDVQPEQGGAEEELYEHFGYPKIPDIPSMPPIFHE